MDKKHILAKGLIATASLVSVGAQVTSVMAAEELTPDEVGHMSQPEVDNRTPQEEQNLQNVNSQLATVNSQISQYTNERAEIEHQIEAKKAEIEADKATLAKTEAELTEASTQAANAQAEAQATVDKLTSEKDKLEADKKALEEKIENLKKEQTELTPKVADIAPLEADLIAKTTELNDKTTELKTRQNALDEVTKQLDKLKADKEALTAELTAKQEELKTLEATKAEAQATEQSKTEEKGTLETKIAEVTQSITNKQAEIDALGVDEAGLTIQKQNLEKSVTDLTNEVATLNQDLQAKKDRLAEVTSPELKTQIQGKKDEVAGLTGEISALDNTIAEQTQAKTTAEQAKAQAEQAKSAKEAEKASVQSSIDTKTQELATLEAKQKEVEDKIAQATDNSSFLNFLKTNGGAVPNIKVQAAANNGVEQPKNWEEYFNFVMETPIKMVVQKDKNYNQVKTVREWLNGDETAFTTAKDNLMRMANTVTELNNRRKAAGLEPVKVDVRSMLTQAVAVAIGANNYWYHTYANGPDNLYTMTGREQWIGNDSTYEKESMTGWWDEEVASNGGHYKWFSDQYGKLYAVAPYMYVKTGVNQRAGVGRENTPTFYSGVGLDVANSADYSSSAGDVNHIYPLWRAGQGKTDAEIRAYMTEENGFFTEERFRELASNWVNKVAPQQLQDELNNAKALVEAKKAEKAEADTKLAEINKAIEEAVKNINAEQAKADNATQAIQTATDKKTEVSQKKAQAEQKLAELEELATHATEEAQRLADEINALKANIETKTGALDNAKHALDEFNKLNAKFNALVAEKNALVSDKDAKQADLNKVISALAENATKLADVQNQIVAKNTEISNKQSEITNKDNAIAPVEADKTSKEQLVADQNALVEAQKALVEQAKTLLETQKNINKRVDEINAELPTLNPTMYDADIATKGDEITAANATLTNLSTTAQAEADKLAKFKSEYEARHSDDYPTVNDLGLHEAEYNTLMSNLEAQINKLNELATSKTTLESDSKVIANNIALLNKASEGFKAILANLARIEAQNKQLALEQSTKDAEKKAEEAKKSEESKKSEDKKTEEAKKSEDKQTGEDKPEVSATTEDEKKSGVDPLVLAGIAGGTVLAVTGGYIIYLAGKKKKDEEEN